MPHMHDARSASHQASCVHVIRFLIHRWIKITLHHTTSSSSWSLSILALVEIVSILATSSQSSNLIVNRPLRRCLSVYYGRLRFSPCAVQIIVFPNVAWRRESTGHALSCRIPASIPDEVSALLLQSRLEFVESSSSGLAHHPGLRSLSSSRGCGSCGLSESRLGSHMLIVSIAVFFLDVCVPSTSTRWILLSDFMRPTAICKARCCSNSDRCVRRQVQPFLVFWNGFIFLEIEVATLFTSSELSPTTSKVTASSGKAHLKMSTDTSSTIPLSDEAPAWFFCSQDCSRSAPSSCLTSVVLCTKAVSRSKLFC